MAIEKANYSLKGSVKLVCTTVKTAANPIYIERYRKVFTLRDPGTLFFRWQAGVPEFHTDFYEYVWQRHTEPPGFESVKFSVRSAPLNSLNVFILFDSTVPNSKCTESLRPFQEYLRIRKEKLPCSTTQPHTVETELISSIYAIFVIIIADTKSFLDNLCERLAQLVSFI
jgi:hypothetical protein